jgi:integrase
VPGRYECNRDPRLAELLHHITEEGWGNDSVGDLDEDGFHASLLIVEPAERQELSDAFDRDADGAVRARHHPQGPQRRGPLGAADSQPALHAAVPRPRRAELVTWTTDELRHFLAYVRDDRLYAAWRLAALTGMPREVLGLRWADLDLEAAGCQSARRWSWSTSTRRSPGPRPLRADRASPWTLRPSRHCAHHTAQAAEQLVAGPAWPNSDLVFTREGRASLHPEHVRRQFDRHLHRAGLPRIRFHDLRHTYATLALEAGVHPKGRQRAARPDHRGNDPGRLLSRHPRPSSGMLRPPLLTLLPVVVSRGRAH